VIACTWTITGTYYYGSPHPYDLKLAEEESEEQPYIDIKQAYTSHKVPVQFITDQGREPYPIIGYAGESLESWTRKGAWGVFFKGDLNDLKLVPVEPVKHVLYFNVYQHGIDTYHTSREQADIHIETGRLACIRIEYTEGQFDE
jgi:hypothetical protein